MKDLQPALGSPPRTDSPDVSRLRTLGDTERSEALGPDGDTRYHRDAEGVHYVPKRALEDLILG